MTQVNALLKSIVDNNVTNTSIIGSSVVRTPVTKTVSNTYGDETLTTGTNETINCFMSLDFKKTNRYFTSEEGEVLSGDAFILVKSTQTLNRNDIITYDGNKYRVADVYRMTVNNVLTGTQGNLFLIE